MLSSGFVKPALSIRQVGRLRFWTGIMLGILIAVVLTSFFNYSREALRTMSFLHDLHNLPLRDFRRWDLFFASFATSIGFGFSIICWMLGSGHRHVRRYKRRYAAANAWFINVVAFMVITRLGSLLGLMHPIFSLTVPDFDVLNQNWVMLMLIPVCMFFAHWNVVRLIYRTHRWIWISGLGCLTTAMGLTLSMTVDRSILNETYAGAHHERLTYIDETFDQAAKLGVPFNEGLKSILAQQRSITAAKLVIRLRQAFQSTHPLPLDTLLLQKIVIHNLSSTRLFRPKMDEADAHWPYPLPKEIYHQIVIRPKGDPAVPLLCEILREQISLLADASAPRGSASERTNYQRERSYHARYLLLRNTTIQSRLIQVCEALREDASYARYHHLLPKPVFADPWRNQEQQKIVLVKPQIN